MTCGHCGGANVASASKCDHCGRDLPYRPLTADASAQAPALQTEDAALDPESDRERDFTAALLGATPAVPVSAVLVVLNVAVYLWMVARGIHPFSPTTDQLIRWGADYGPLTQSGQWWRLFTAAFIHIGAFHLAMNMLVLWTGGPLIERLFGQVSFVALYVVSALGGSLTSLALHPMTTSAGASGAIFGIYGGLIAYLIVCRASLPPGIRSTMIQSAVTFVAYNLIYGLALPHVDVAAHLGGLLSGFISGAVMATPIGSPFAVRSRRALIAIAVSAAVMTVVAVRLPRFDDWGNAVSAWLKDEASVDGRIAQEAAKVDARQIPPQQFADRIEREFIPELTQQRARMSALRLPPAERAKATGVIAFLGLKIDALKLTAEAVRTGSAETHELASKKNEEALAALLTVMPNPALVARIQQQSEHRQLQRSFTDEIKRLQDVERATNAAYTDAVKRVRVNHSPPSEFAALVDSNVLKPWNAERERLATLAIPPEQKEARQRFLDYMTLRAEAWQLVAKGVSDNDPKQIRLAGEKNAAAAKLLQQR
jgi:membrane associated rhomboid family serine protease